MKESQIMSPHWLEGGCHCGRVRFAAQYTGPVCLHACNCSMCQKQAFIHWLLEAADFRLLQGVDALTEYRFNTGQARHLFCRHCGVKSFYVPRSNPNGYSVNARCLDSAEWQQWPQQGFDGQNWESAIVELPA